MLVSSGIMASNGGTLHGIPPTPRGQYNCSQCGLTFDSANSLEVHNMNYHPESMSRWGTLATNGGGTSVTTSSTASNSPTDSENNNHPKRHHHNSHQSVTSKSSSPMRSTISAAADSSDNQPPTPQPTSGSGTGTSDSRTSSYLSAGGGSAGTGSSSPYQHQSTAEMHYPTYMHGYEQYYHHHHQMEYGLPPPHFLNNQSAQQEYKAVPSPRYHPYLSHSMNQLHQNSGNATSSVSPRIVSSSSPTQNSLMHATTTAPSNAQIPPGQPTPSPSPKQCDKCGLVCETACQLSDHYATAHGTQTESSGPLNRSASGEETELPAFNYQFIKEEPPCDILDLDSQKMVYPPHDGSVQGTLPPMHSLHAMQRPPMMWPHDHHAFIPPHPQDIKPSIFSINKQDYVQPAPIKSEFSPTTIIKSEYQQQQPHQNQLNHPTSADIKSFNNEVTGNQVATSPSDFPTTTTPQENGVQFRTFEPATSSLPNNPPSTKSTSWKSNEARRPKTYNCTACNKWFTSSGHLKRHYNTTLHKNAVKSSGQPDPATMPISVHHHPARDQNHKQHHRNSPAQGPPPIPPEPPRSPADYLPQYTPPLGFQQAPGFQQYGTSIHSNAGVPPNGQAGLSVRASQPRGLLIYLTNTGTQHMLPEQPEHQTFMQQIQPQQLQPYNTITTTNLTEQFNIISPTTINTSTQSYPVTPHPEALQPNYHIITGNSMESCEGSSSTDSLLTYDQMLEEDCDDQRPQQLSYSAATIPSISALRRLTGGAAAYQGDTAPPFSPDIPESFHHQIVSITSRSPAAPLDAATTPLSPPAPAPGSPSITSTGTQVSSDPAEHRCVQCDKVFNKACYLTQHNKTFHSGEKPYKCKRCGKRFPCGQSHEEHFAKHGNDKPFKCEQCPKQFNHKTDLRRHMCLHSGSKPYACEMCGKGFIRKDHMLKHCETHRRKSAHLAKKLNDPAASSSANTLTIIKNNSTFTNAPVLVN